MASLLTNIGNVLRAIPPSESKLVRQSFSSMSRRQTVRSDKWKGPTTPHTRSKAVPFVTGEDGRLLPGECVHVCLCTCVCACAYAGVYVHVCVCVLCVCVVCVCVLCVCVCVYVCICVH